MPDVSLHPLLDVLLAGGARAERLTASRTFPERAAEHASWPRWADATVVQGYRKLGVERPWTHQAVAADLVHQGRHTALATSTGSGKSLAFWLPALSAVRTAAAAATLDPGNIQSAHIRPTTIYLSPTKALAADQLSALERILDAAGTRDVRVATCDGDTSREERSWVQDHADVVLTNPDFLHYALLPNHRRWSRLLKGLRYVVVDEGHAYRGVFGAHVSLVLRRLARLAARYGEGSPTFVVASATTAEPAVSAARLIGVAPDDVTAVTEDASPSGRRTVVLWQPPEIVGWRPPADGEAGADVDTTSSMRRAGHDEPDPWALPATEPDPEPDPEAEPVATEAPPEHPRRSATAEVADLLADLSAAGARTLAFTRSRRGAESVAQQARDHLRHAAPDAARRIAAYRGGYLPEERRELEQALRSGDLLGLATTNALELGVDISGLDAVLIAGWPGTRMSLWQQAGRAGRAGADGLVAFVAREDPLDTYLVTHPEAVFDAPLEATVFDPANPHVLAPHLCAAAQEAPLRAEDLAAFGDPDHVRGILKVLVARGALRRRTSGWYWTHHQAAAGLTDLRGAGGTPVRVVEQGTGRMLGTVDAASADGQVHDGAVYVHQGTTYVVAHLDLTDHTAVVQRRRLDYGTWSRSVMSVAIEGWGEDAEASGDPGVEAEHEDGPGHDLVTREWGPITWGLGPVEVTSQVVSFQRRRIPDMQVLGTEQLELPEHTLGTVAVWWSVPEFVLRAADITPEQTPGALHAAEHASIGLLPLLATCDRWDLGGVSTELHPDTGEATVFVYDAYPGGAGFAERAYDLGATWLRATRDAIAACPCADGCPACVQSPKCGSYNAPLDKAAAVRLLDAVLSHEPHPNASM
ncbi:DEAD/DEAH box helicase [Promicromonospora iranensis]|uniref:DEAD/DEAH box helicase domain-containing protein n=1 Tax=Promicromonospora iranensis TaxID=1105144 RepID=A0ABU2CP83_9MICO|nr:DEAD/DEAH box helicase [Promicromonospora iranensis]MDR7382952.1 DEAD/DEAH box helicase domain-containing protein [Promicromonospora iranensis]